MSYEGPERRQTSGWHLEKSVSVSHIITTVFAVVSAILWLTDLDKRITLVESVTKQQKDIDHQQDTRMEVALGILRSDMREINQKLDRLIERGK